MADDPRQAIMEATFNALSKASYADLTMQDIATELGKSKSLLHYHFDSKDDLITAFLDWLAEHMETELADIDPADPESLKQLIDLLLGVEDSSILDFHRALFEIASQAPYDEELARRFRELDRLIHQTIAAILDERGVERNKARADLILSAMNGKIHRELIMQDGKELTQIRDDLLDNIKPLLQEGETSD